MTGSYLYLKKLFYIVITSVLISISYSQLSLAVCSETGMTPGGGNIIDCPPPVQNTNISTGTAVATTNFADRLNILSGGGVVINGGGVAVNTSNGDDIINVNGQIIHNNNNTALVVGNGSDSVFVNTGGIISSSTIAIGMVGGDNFVQLNGGTISGGIRGSNEADTVEMVDGLMTDDAVTLRDGDDIVRILGGTIEEGTLFMGDGNDTVILSDGTFLGEVGIDLDEGNDTLTISNDFNILDIECDEGFDTVTFAMEVEEGLFRIARELAQADPSQGSITINGFTYEWFSCERIVDDLKGDRSPPVIPTLSQWGLISMAAILGIVGFMVIRRRQLTTNS